MTNKIGIIFDMDGVIIDNHTSHVKAWMAFCTKYGKGLTEDKYRENINGRTAKDIIQYFFGQDVRAERIKELTNEKESLYRELHKPLLALTPGLAEFLDSCHAEEIPMAVATSAPTANVVFTIDGLKIRNYFTAILDESNVSKGKPNPEIYQKAAAALELDSGNCVVFEDAIAGIKAGKSAGSKVVGVATSHKLEELTLTDKRINDFTEITLDQVTELIQ